MKVRDDMICIGNQMNKPTWRYYFTECNYCERPWWKSRIQLGVLDYVKY